MPETPRRLAELTTASGQPLVGPLVRQAYRWFADGMAARLADDAEPALSIAQVEMFANIDTDGTSIAELARRGDVTRQTAHRLVHDLTTAGMVELTTDPASARRRLVRLTRRGHRHLLAAQLTLVELEDRLIERLGGDAVDGLRETLGRDWGPPVPGAHLRER